MRSLANRAKFALPAIVAVGFAFLLIAQPRPAGLNEKLARVRNLGKAFYENPTTTREAVNEFHEALTLAPDSAREHLNYGLALLRAGQTAEGEAELRKAQKLDPKIPHTWFNLGIAFKREGDLDGALAQFREMEKLVPSEPVTHYQIGSILRAQGDIAAAAHEFEIARDLAPHLAGPHFQLYNVYRQMGKPQEAAAELRIFQQLKKEQEGAAVPEDMEWSSYAEVYDPTSLTPSPALPQPVYRAEKVADGFDGVTSLALGGGSQVSLIAWSAARTVLFRDGKPPAVPAGLEGLRDVVFIAPGDFDNDGLPDLCVVTTSGATLYRNVNGTFHKQADLAAGHFREAVWIDYDHDYDLDLILLGDPSKLLRNNGSAGFGDETARFPFVDAPGISATRFDLEPDTPGFDLVASYRNRPGVLYRDKLGGNYAAQDIPQLPANASGLGAGDFNHDSRTDISAQPDIVLLNRPNGFERVTRPVPPGVPFPQDGRLNRAFAKDGAVWLDRDVTPNPGNWIGIALTGVKNLKSAIGAKVEVKSGALYEKQTYAGIPLIFRLGTHNSVDTVRITWANGLVQNEMNQPVNKLVTIKEAPRLSGSCPMIFTWNGSRFTFITDVLGVAPLGASSGDGRYFPVDHDEYVSIPGEKLVPRDGSYDVRITEELHEVSYIDQVKLLALDHPADLDVVTNEKFKSPPFPEFRLFGVSHRIYPVAARDQNGADVRSALLRTDFTYPDSFRRTQAGVAEMHTLDLDFGRAAPSNHAVLILHGWVDWADGSTFLGAMQEHKDLTFPYLQVKDAAGQWRTVVEDMGIPSGKPKTMAVDLTGKFLSASREVRIVTNLCVYWDEIYLSDDAAPPPAHLAAAPVVSADLHFRGFSRATINPQRKQPEKFDYDVVREVSNWNPTHGLYTRYGDVQPLVLEPDDRMVIMGSGDEMALRFGSAGLPPLPAGWRRDFLLLVDGWAKDADANTAFSQSVLPLPFHAMSSYPYPPTEHFPSDKIHEEYIREYNTRPALRLLRSLGERTN